MSAGAFEFLDCVQFRGAAPGLSATGKGPGGGLGCNMADPSGGATPELMQERVAAVAGCAMLFCKGLSDLQVVKVQHQVLGAVARSP